ncbi:MAG: hypothetical protein ACTSWN_09420 [Promethearchaeota archaeon]
MNESRSVQELLEKFKKIIKVTQRINKSEVARYLGISDIGLLSFIADLGEDLPVKIDADYIVVDNFNDFVDYIAKQFGTWSEMESTKEGKRDATTGFTKVSPFSQPSNIPTTTARGIKATESQPTS